LTTTTDVENWPADVQGVQGPELMERFMQHAERFVTRHKGRRKRSVNARISDAIEQERVIVKIRGTRARQA